MHKRAAGFAAVLACLLSLGSSASAQTPPAVQKYIAWRGGEAFTKLTVVTQTGSFADGGLSGPAAMILTGSGNTRKTLQYGPYATALTVAGQTGFYTNLSGQLLPLSRIEVDYARRDSMLLLPAAFATRLVAEKPEIAAGKKWDVVETASGDARYDFFIGPDGALYGVRTKRNGGTEWEIYSNWKTVDGIRLPFSVHDQGDAGLGVTQDDTTDFTVANAAVNPALGARAFAPMPDRQVVDFAGSGSSDWIPIEISDHHIFLDLQVNGHEVQGLLDSGAGTTVIDSQFAAPLGIHPVGNFLTEGQGGSAGVSYAPHIDILVGGVHLTDITPGLIDLGLPGTQMKPPLEVILGAEIFTQAAVDIDYPRHRIRFLRPGKAALPGAVSLPLETFEGSFALPVSVEGKPPIQILLDTGNDGVFQLFPAYWQQPDLLQGRMSSIVREGGVGGYVEVKRATLSLLELSRLRLKAVPTDFELPGTDTDNETGLLGHCGDALLERFHVVVDFPDRRILLAPGPAAFAPFAYDLVGLQTTPAGQQLKITFVMPGSPAARAGLQAGKVITAIDGKPVQGGNAPDNWTNGIAGQKLALKFSDGSSVTLIRARFY